VTNNDLYTLSVYIARSRNNIPNHRKGGHSIRDNRQEDECIPSKPSNIIVKTNYPIVKVLGKPDLVGRMISWMYVKMFVQTVCMQDVWQDEWCPDVCPNCTRFRPSSTRLTTKCHTWYQTIIDSHSLQRLLYLRISTNHNTVA